MKLLNRRVLEAAGMKSHCWHMWTKENIFNLIKEDILWAPYGHRADIGNIFIINQIHNTTILEKY